MDQRLSSQLLVLDSWPVLEWLKGREPASRKFDEVVRRARDGAAELAMCRLNFGEVIYTIRKSPEFFDREGALQTLRALPVNRHSVDDALVDAAVELKSSYSMAYADAFAAALSIRLSVPLVTGDREFLALERAGLLKLYWLGA